MLDYRLGLRAFSTFSVWLAAIVWTVAYSEGAGLGAFAYACAEKDAYMSPCTLVPHQMLPPAVSPSIFVANVATVWAPGFYDSGIIVGFFLTVGALLAACCMRRYVAERVFSWPLARGYPHVPAL